MKNHYIKDNKSSRLEKLNHSFDNEFKSNL